MRIIRQFQTKTNHPAYTTVHTRLRKHRGRAGDRLCACGNQARDWALIGPGELTCRTTGHPYSADLMAYEPRCRSCHMRMDLGKVLVAA